MKIAACGVEGRADQGWQVRNRRERHPPPLNLTGTTGRLWCTCCSAISAYNLARTACSAFHFSNTAVLQVHMPGHVQWRTIAWVCTARMLPLINYSKLQSFAAVCSVNIQPGRKHKTVRAVCAADQEVRSEAWADRSFQAASDADSWPHCTARRARAKSASAPGSAAATGPPSSGSGCSGMAVRCCNPAVTCCCPPDAGLTRPLPQGLLLPPPPGSAYCIACAVCLALPPGMASPLLQGIPLAIPPLLVPALDAKLPPGPSHTADVAAAGSGAVALLCGLLPMGCCGGGRLASPAADMMRGGCTTTSRALSSGACASCRGCDAAVPACWCCRWR